MAECGKRQINEKLAAAGLGQGNAEDQEADHEIGEGPQGNAQHAFRTEDMIGDGIRQRTAEAGDRARHHGGI